jgi:hypothetical protein
MFQSEKASTPQAILRSFFACMDMEKISWTSADILTAISMLIRHDIKDAFQVHSISEGNTHE